MRWVVLAIVAVTSGAIMCNLGCAKIGFGETSHGPMTPEVDPIPVITNATAIDMTGLADPHIQVSVLSDLGEPHSMQADDTGRFSINVPLPQNAMSTFTVTATNAPDKIASTGRDVDGALLRVQQDTEAPHAGFTDATVEANLRSAAPLSTWAGPVLIADLNNDGALDLYLTNQNAYHLNDGGGHFTSFPGLDNTSAPSSRGAVAVDYDNDGDLDIVLHPYEHHEDIALPFFRNDLAETGVLGFTETTTDLGIEAIRSNGGGLGVIDYDMDGWPDIFLEGGDAPLGNVMFHNDSGSGFTRHDSQDPIGINTETINNGQWISLCDYDVDGDIDILIRHPEGVGQLYQNQGDGTFQDVTGEASGVLLGDPDGRPTFSGSVFGDFDNDGDFDIFVANGDPVTPAHLLFLQSSDGTFEEHASEAGLLGIMGVDAGGRGVDVGDFNHDGWLDLVIADDHANCIYLNHGPGAGNVPIFTEVAFGEGLEGLAGLGPAMFADLDNDGDLDIFFHRDYDPEIYLRNGLNDARYLKVKLVGAGPAAGLSSRDAVGSVVRLWDRQGNLVGMREVNGAKGTGCQKSAILHFGGITPSEEYRVEARFLRSTVWTTVVPRSVGHLLVVHE